MQNGGFSNPLKTPQNIRTVFGEISLRINEHTVNCANLLNRPTLVVMS